jgi:outer membrane protein assembly factor BamD
MKRAYGAGIPACVALVVSLSLTALASPDVVWTPEKGWQREGTASEVEGAREFDKAFSLYMSGKYRRAAGAFEKVAKDGNVSLREEAAILLAESHLGAGEYRAAFERYEDFLKDYPASRWTDRAMQGEVEAAKAALKGAKVRYLKVKWWSGYGFGEKAADKIVSRRPFSTFAREAQMALARSYYKRRLYIEAASAYRQYLELFPQSPDTPEALLGVGKSILYDARGPRYNPLPYYRSQSAFKAVARDYPGTQEAKEAAQLDEKAEESLAEHYFLVGKWYLKMHRVDPAAAYFRKVLREFPQTQSAESAKIYADALGGAGGGGDGK